MPHDCELFFKTILTDKTFDVNIFIRSGLVEFYNQILDYLNGFHGEKGEKGLFGRKKYPDSKSVLAALQKVMPNVKTSGPLETIFPAMNSIFEMWLHPDTPHQTRSAALHLFLDILPIIPESHLDQFKSTLLFLIPFQKFYRNDEEMANFSTVTTKIHPVMDASPAVTHENGVEDLKYLLNYILTNWTKIPNYCYRILYDDIFLVLYRMVAINFGYNTTYGFNSRPVEELHNEVMKTIGQIVSQKIGYDLVFRTEQSAKLFIQIICTSALFKGYANHNIALNMLSDLLELPSPLLRCGKQLILHTGNGFEIIKSEELPSDPASLVLAAQNRYLSTMLTAMMSLPEKYQLISDMFSILEPTPYTHAVFILAYIEFSIKNNLFEDEHWKIITDMMAKNDIASSVTSYYAQFLLVHGYVHIFHIDKAQTIDICEKHMQRKLRNRQDTPFDFLAENIKCAFGEPNEFVRTFFFKQKDQHIQMNPVIEKLFITSLTIKGDECFSTIERYLHVFTHYTDYPAGNERISVFRPLQIFTATCIRMTMVPPGVQFNHTVTFRLCVKRLLRAAIAQDDSSIRRNALELLSVIFSDSAIKAIANESVLTNWYAAICLMMVSFEPSERDLGVRKAITMMNDGFTGSSMLAEVVIKLCEKGLVELKEHIFGFLGSFPLFAAPGSFPSPFVKFLGKIITAHPPQFVSGAIDFFNLSPNNDLHQRSLAIIKKYCDYQLSQQEQHWEFVLPAISAFIANEITQDQPNTKQINDFLRYLLEGIKARSFEALMIVRSLIMYINEFDKLMKKEIVAFIHAISNIVIELTPTDPQEWTFNLVKLLADIYIMSYCVIQTSEEYRKFVHFMESTTHKRKTGQPWPDEISRLFADTLSILTQYYGSYPFPGEAQLPSNNEAKFKDDCLMHLYSSNIKGSNEPNMFHVTTNEDSCSISSQTNVGHFRWEFAPIDPYHKEKPSVPPISLPLQKNVTTQNVKQEAFNNVVDQVVKSFEQQFQLTLKLFEDPSIDLTDPLDKNESYSKAFQSSKEDGLVQPIRPPTKVYNISAAALQACGRVRMDKMEQIQLVPTPVSILQRLRKAQTQDHRRGVKIGVVFVGKDKIDQNQILCTTYDESSARFREFITGLGWPILLKTHIGYDGGLDINRNGKTSIYYTDFMNEMMFHIATLLPTDPNDSQQIYKKRHIGNDHIHIVWCEDLRDYDPSTITSQFNQAHFMIYPLQTGLFRVDIKWRSELDWFGPLRYPIIVSKKVLPSLIRTTTMQAMNAYYRTQKPYSYPQAELVTLKAQILESSTGNSAPYQAVMQLMITPPQQE